MAKPRLTPKQVQYLVAEYTRGRTCPGIGAELGIHPVSVLNYLKKNNVPRRKAAVPEATPEIVEAAKALRAEGLLWKQVAAKVGLSANTLIRHSKEARMHYKKLNEEQVARMVEAYKDGASSEAAGALVKVSASTARVYLREAGVEIRPFGATRLVTDADIARAKELRANKVCWKLICRELGFGRGVLSRGIRDDRKSKDLA